MRLTVSAKLVLSFLLVTALVLAATLLLARWSFERGFLDYVNALEQNRLQRLALVLAGRYEADGESWRNIGNTAFGELNRRSLPRDAKRPAPRDAGRRPPPADPANHARPGPPGERRPPRGSSRGPRGGTRVPAGPPTALVGTDGILIAGVLPTLARDRVLDERQADLIVVPVMSGGVQIAQLRSAPIRQLSTPQATEFAAEQFRTSLLIGALSLAIAVIVSTLLAKAFLLPLRKTIGAVRQLAGGDYSVRMEGQRNDEFGELMMDVDRLGLALEENRASRRRWLADVSHELRTPVAILAGEIEAMRDGVRQLNQKGLASLDYETARLKSLINDLYELSLSDIGGLRYEFAALDLADLALIATEPLRTRATVLGLDLQVNAEEGCIVRADASRLQQLIANLLQNAMNYTDSPGQIEVRVFKERGAVCLAVLDSAPGIKESKTADDDALKLLFEPLYRADESRTRNDSGAGLGLAICRNVALAHGATIEASNSSLGGLCVTVRFQT